MKKPEENNRQSEEKDKLQKKVEPSIADQKKKEENSTLQILESNSRCVPVGTFLITPDGRNEKKERFKGKSEFIKFRCSIYEKKLLRIKAKHSGLSLSEFCRRSIYEKEIKERLSDDQIEIYKTLSKFHNNFKSIGNMFRRKDPKLSRAVYELADKIKIHLQNIKR